MHATGSRYASQAPASELRLKSQVLYDTTFHQQHSSIGILAAVCSCSSGRIPPHALYVSAADRFLPLQTSAFALGPSRLDANLAHRQARHDLQRD